MTDEMLNLRLLVEKSADSDLLREMIGFTAQRLMELEVGAATGAGHGEKNPMRLAQRNGYRDHDWETRAGTGRWCGDQISTFCNYVAAIENSTIDPACRTSITPPAAITSVK